MSAQETVEKYFKMTGTSQDLFPGEEFFGIAYIIETLVPQALSQGKKIVYKDEPEKGIGAMSYSFEKL